MLIYQGKKMTLPLGVKKPFGIDACLLNEPDAAQCIARVKPYSRAGCGITKASPRRDLAQVR
jgi:hypothetical protein